MESNGIVNTICEAWQAKQPGILGNILSSDFEWYDSPFEEMITDRSQLIQRWQDDIASQENISVVSDIVTDTDDTIVAHWRAEFDRNDTRETLDGIFVLGKSKDGLLNMFKMWWVSK